MISNIILFSYNFNRHTHFFTYATWSISERLACCSQNELQTSLKVKKYWTGWMDRWLWFNGILSTQISAVA